MPGPLAISKADLARKCGVTKGRLTQLAQGTLAPAVLDDGRIDATHPVVREWLDKRGVNIEELELGIAPKGRTGGGKPPGADKQKASEAQSPGASEGKLGGAYEVDHAALESMTLREIVRRYGNLPAFSDHVDVLKKITEISRISLQNQETSGKLISRELVKTHVFGMIDGAFMRLLRDMPQALASRLAAMVRAGATNEEIQALIRKEVSQNLENIKTSAARVLRAKRASKGTQDEAAA